MKRAARDALREEEAKAKLYAEMPLRELEPLAQPTSSNKCRSCYLCIEHMGCLLDHPPPEYCAGARHHYLWRTRHRAERALQNLGPWCEGCGAVIEEATWGQRFCFDCIDSQSRAEAEERGGVA